jgi:lipopolysaccharide biosynthesis glycosyltransferase
LPDEIFSAFPQTLECVLVPSRGWCVVEERVENYDGTAPHSFCAAYRAADESGRRRLQAAFKKLFDGFINHAIRLYDPQNVVVQKISEEDFTLRILDFEPASRTFIPIDSMLPFLVRKKTARRVRRWLKEQLGVELDRMVDYVDEKPPISMSFSVSDNYSQHLAVVLTSFLANNPGSRFVFHVLHRNISEENQLRIRELEEMYPNGRIYFHLVDATLFESFPIPKELEHVTKEMYFRYALPDILQDEKRTIYSDVDVLCVGDVRPLWEIDLNDCVIGAVSEREAGEFKKELLGLTGDAPYFNSGMLVMDLDVMRAECSSAVLMENTVKYADRIAWPDQDVINITFRNRILELPFIWNCFVSVAAALKEKVVIWHFANFTQKPWCNIWKNTTWPIYLKYLLKSSYSNNAWLFVWGHIKGFFFFKYIKKHVTRYLICGIRVWKR